METKGDGKTKDFFDKLSSLSGVFIAIAGFMATYIYNNNQINIQKQKATPANEVKAPPAAAAHLTAPVHATYSKESLQLTITDSLEVQQLLYICASTLYNWRQKGLLASSKVDGRVYFEAADVYQKLADRKQRKWKSAV
jgi:hypothetical protein